MKKILHLNFICLIFVFAFLFGSSCLYALENTSPSGGGESSLDVGIPTQDNEEETGGSGGGSGAGGGGAVLPASTSNTTGSNTGSTSDDLASFLDGLGGLINIIFSFIVGLAVLSIVWGIFKFIANTDEESRKGAKAYIVWGVIGVFLMLSIWGLVAILKNTFNLDSSKGQVVDKDLI